MNQNGDQEKQSSGSGWRGPSGVRTTYLIDRPLQTKLITYSFRHILIVVAAVAFVLFAPTLNMRFEDSPQARAAVESATRLLQLHSRFWMTAVLVVMLVAVDALRLSHRIAGPLHRFRVALRQWRSGEIPDRIRLRDGDLLHEFCEEVNAALDEARAVRDVQVRRNQELQDLVGEAQTVCRDSGGEVAMARVREILGQMDEIVTVDSVVRSASGTRGETSVAASGNSETPADADETRRAA